MNCINRYYPQLERTLSKCIYYCYKGGDPIVKPLEECIAKWRNGEEIYEEIGQVFLPPQSLCPELSRSSESEISVLKRQAIVEGQLLGRGAFARVYMGYISGKVVVAVKEYTLSNSATEMSAKNELESLKRLRGHPNVIQLEGYCSEPEKFLLALQFFQQGRDLKKICLQNIREKCWFDEKDVDTIVSGILNGLTFIHSQHIAHLDIKVKRNLIRMYALTSILNSRTIF